MDSEIAKAKAQSTKSLEFVASEGMQIFGGAGYLTGNPVERVWREVKVMAIGGGSEEIMRDLAVRQTMFGLPLFKTARLEITSLTGMPEGGLAVGEEATCDAEAKLTIGAVAEELAAPIKISRTSEDAFHLGIVALEDRSFMVRWRACGLLAYSQRRDALPALKQAARHEDERTQADARAAITAIKKKNHHLFVDRDRSGRVQWRIGPPDENSA